MLSVSIFYVTFILRACVCDCVSKYACKCHSEHFEVRRCFREVNFLILLCAGPGGVSSSQAWQQPPLPAESPCPPTFSFLVRDLGITPHNPWLEQRGGTKDENFLLTHS